MTIFRAGDIVRCNTYDYQSINKGQEFVVTETGECSNGDQWIKVQCRKSGRVPYTSGYRSKNFQLIGRADPDQVEKHQYIVVETYNPDRPSTASHVASDVIITMTEAEMKEVVEDYVRKKAKEDPEFESVLLFKAVEKFSMQKPPVKREKLA